MSEQSVTQTSDRLQSCASSVDSVSSSTVFQSRSCDAPVFRQLTSSRTLILSKEVSPCLEKYSSTLSTREPAKKKRKVNKMGDEKLESKKVKTNKFCSTESKSSQKQKKTRQKFRKHPMTTRRSSEPPTNLHDPNSTTNLPHPNSALSDNISSVECSGSASLDSLTKRSSLCDSSVRPWILLPDSPPPTLQLSPSLTPPFAPSPNITVFSAKDQQLQSSLVPLASGSLSDAGLDLSCVCPPRTQNAANSTRDGAPPSVFLSSAPPTSRLHRAGSILRPSLSTVSPPSMKPPLSHLAAPPSPCFSLSSGSVCQPSLQPFTAFSPLPCSPSMMALSPPPTELSVPSLPPRKPFPAALNRFPPPPSPCAPSEPKSVSAPPGIDLANLKTRSGPVCFPSNVEKNLLENSGSCSKHASRSFSTLGVSLPIRLRAQGFPDSRWISCQERLPPCLR